MRRDAIISMPVIGPIRLVRVSTRRAAVVAIALLAFAAISMLSTFATRTSVTARPATHVRTLSCEALVDVPGKSVTTALVSFPPDAYTPAHRHPGSVTAYVISGSVRSQIDGTPPKTYGTGSTWFEPAGALHLFAENPSPSDSAELLAVFITDHGCGPLVIPESQRAGPH